MAYRSTPISVTGVSPAQLMMGRQMRTNLPVLQKKLRPQWRNRQTVKKADEKAKSKYRFYFDRKHQVHSLSDLKPGDTVRIKEITTGLLQLLRLRKQTHTVHLTSLRLPTVYSAETVVIYNFLLQIMIRVTRLCVSPINQLNMTRSRKRQKSDAPVIETSIPTELTVPTTESNKNPDQPSTPVKTSSGRLVCRPLKFKDFVC